MRGGRRFNLRNNSVRIVLMLAGGTWLVGPLDGQQRAPVTIQGVPACPTCRIVEERLFGLGSPSDPLRLATIGNIERDARGRLFAMAEDLHHVVVFDSAGKYLTALGGRGQGPGEFDVRIGRIRIGPGDTVYVGHGSRLSVFAPNLRFVRRIQLPSQIHEFHLLPGGGMIAAMAIYRPDRVGYPLHVFDGDWKVIRSFGPEHVISPPIPRGQPAPPGYPRPTPLPDVNYRTHFRLAADGRSIWLGQEDYSFVQWSVAGREVARMAVAAPWTTPGRRPVWDSVVVNGRVQRFQVSGIAVGFLTGVDNAGLLWFTGRIPVPGLRGTPTRSLEYSYVREVVDPVSATVLASARSTFPLFMIPRTQLGYMAELDTDGFPQYTIYRVRLEGRVPPR